MSQKTLPATVKIMIWAVLTVVVSGCQLITLPTQFRSNWPVEVTRTWIGPDYWSNRLQDWRLAGGRLECLASDVNRNVNLLTVQSDSAMGTMKMSVRLGLLDTNNADSDRAWTGFRVGIRGQFDDYRDSAVHGQGLNAGVTTDGQLFIGDYRPEQPANLKHQIARALLSNIELRLVAKPLGPNYKIKLSVYHPKTRQILTVLYKDDIPAERLIGNLALVSHLPQKKKSENDPSCWFADWRLSGDKLIYNKSHAYGPVLFSQYTLSRNILKMSAQMAPVGASDSPTVSMQIQDNEDETWNEVASASIDPMARTATFRVEPWDNTQDTPYRLVYDFVDSANTLQTAYFAGVIRREPLEKEEIVVAGFTGNNDLGFPNNDVTAHVKAHDPDLLFFSGDQIYEGVGGFGHQTSPVDKATLDYLRKWYIFGWTYRDLMRDRPAVSIPDDHDVYHGNIWGAGGRATPEAGSGAARQDAGGYKMPPEWVNMVERTQTSHLPDPYDPTPVEQGIGVYYCELNYAGISFAVLEDRKFKSAPKGLLPNAQITNGWPASSDYNAAAESDAPGAVLLGERQLKFLQDWADDWSGGTWMKVVLSQTIFANVATLPEGVSSGAVTPRLPILEPGQYAPNEWRVHDHDSNGWPQSGRNRALREMRKAFAVHIAGDQHLGSTIQYGIDKWRDAGFALCVPAVSNIWPRRWYPPEPGLNQEPNALGYTGDYKDGFGNLMTVHAVSNPSLTGRQPVNLYDRATGFGLVRFQRSTRDVTIECWPRLPQLFQDNGGQYPGWPVKFNQLDNYGPEPVEFLPTFSITNLDNPVFQIIDESNNEILYTLRINGAQFRPKVFKKGNYTVKIGEPDTEKMKIYENVPSMPPEQNLVVEYVFPITQE